LPGVNIIVIALEFIIPSYCGESLDKLLDVFRGLIIKTGWRENGGEGKLEAECKRDSTKRVLTNVCKKGALIAETHPGFFLTGIHGTHIVSARAKTPARILKVVKFLSSSAMLPLSSGYSGGY